MIWVLIVLAVMPLIMGGIIFFMLRRGMHYRLHERRAREAGLAPGSASDPVIVAGWSSSDDGVPFSGDGEAAGSWEAGGGDFGGGGASGDWGGDSGGGDSGGGDGGGGDSGGGGGD